MKKKSTHRKRIHTGYNRHGISRTIPPEVKEQVRKNSGFGCVLCREIPCDYDHFDPEFKDLTVPHDPKGIALLCIKHHGEKTRGLIPTERVTAAYEAGQRQGWAPIKFLGGIDSRFPISVAIANKKFTGSSRIIIYGHEILKIRYDPQNSVFLLNLTVIEDSRIILKIVDNILQSDPGKVLDFKTSANKFSIFTGSPKPVCELTYEPQSAENIIRFSKFSIKFLGYVATIDQSGNFQDNSPLEGLVKYPDGSEVVLNNMEVNIIGHRRGSVSPAPGTSGSIFVKATKS